MSTSEHGALRGTRERILHAIQRQVKANRPRPTTGTSCHPVLSFQLVSVRSQENNEKLQKTCIPAKPSCTLSSINDMAIKEDVSSPG